MNKLLAIVICVVPLIHARSLEGRPTDTCVADYLKSKSLLESEHGSENPVSPLCLSIIQVTKQTIMKGVRENLEHDEKFKNDSNCAIESMRKTDFADQMLLVYFLESNQKDQKVNEILEKTQKHVNEIILRAFIDCEAVKKFSEAFEELFEDKSSSEEEIDDKEDFCIRKHIVKNNLINMKNLKLEVNPKNIETSEIDCNVLYQKALKDAEKELVQALAENSSEENDDSSDVAKLEHCLLKVIRKEHFIDQMLQFDYVKEFDLNPETRGELKSHFIDVMTQLSFKSIKCVI